MINTGNEQLVVEAKTCETLIKPESPGMDCLPPFECQHATERTDPNLKEPANLNSIATALTLVNPFPYY